MRCGTTSGVGLLPEPARSPSGYRACPGEAVRRVRFITRAQELAFALAEVDTLLHLADGEPDSCELVREVAAEKLADLGTQDRRPPSPAQGPHPVGRDLRAAPRRTRLPPRWKDRRTVSKPVTHRVPARWSVLLGSGHPAALWLVGGASCLGLGQ